MSQERIEELARTLEVEVSFLTECRDCGAFHPEEAPGPGVLARLRRLHRLSRTLEVDVYAASIIVELLERIDELERGRPERP